MRIGLIGAGRIGAFHAATLAVHDDVASLVVADADPVRAREVAVAHGAAATSVDALFRSRPDAVVIASATAAHPGLVTKAARLGIPAFCETPPALDLAAAVAVLAAVAGAGGLLQIGFQRRFDDGYRAARRVLREGGAGRLHTVRMVGSDPAPPPPASVPLSGGLYRDCLVHDFDALRWVTGEEISEVHALGANVGSAVLLDAGDADTAAAVLTLDSGVLATATATRYHAAGYDVRMELAGTQDQFAVGLGSRTPLTPLEAEPQPRRAPWPDSLDRFAAAYRAELAAFLRVVQGAQPNPCEGREGLRAMLVAEACEISLRERRPVRVDEVALTAGVREVLA